jgi:hypothetical protein
MSKQTIRPDRVQVTDIVNLKQVYACEDCTYFNSLTKKCILRLNTEFHLKEAQLKKMSISGQMLFCRFLEID